MFQSSVSNLGAANCLGRPGRGPTMLGLMGMDHEELTYLFQGRYQRLTDVGGHNNLAPRLIRG